LEIGLTTPVGPGSRDQSRILRDTGCRNIIDCFSHDTVFTWHKKQKDERKKKKAEDDVNMENKVLKEF
jgi:hypothetical protein